MKVKVNFDIPKIKQKLGLEGTDELRKFVVHTCRVHMDKYVPMANGDLSINAVTEGDDYVKYDTPYAHYMYEGILYVDPQYGVGAFPIKDKAGNLQGFYSRKDVAKVPSSRGLIYNTSQHSEAGHHWDKRMWSAEKEQVIQEVEDYIRRKL